MAVAASFPPETYQLCEQLLLERKVPVKDIYIELASLMLFEEKNLAHFRYWYHLSASNAYKLVRHAWWLPGKKRGQRAGYVLRASRAYCNSLFAPGLADHLIESTTGVDTMNTLGPGLNGFVPLDWQLAHDTGNAELIERREEFRLQPLAGHQRAAYINSLYEGNRDAGISEVHRALLEHLMVLGDEQGVNVHFILPPLWVDQGEDLVALFRSLPMERRFDLCDPKRFPEFYLPENMFDMGHLNTKGAEVFSLRVAAAIKASGQEDRGSSMDNP